MTLPFWFFCVLCGLSLAGLIGIGGVLWFCYVIKRAGKDEQPYEWGDPAHPPSDSGPSAPIAGVVLFVACAIGKVVLLTLWLSGWVAPTVLIALGQTTRAGAFPLCPP